MMTTTFLIDGHVDGQFSDDTAARFEAYGRAIRNVDDSRCSIKFVPHHSAQAEKENQR